MNDKNDEMKYAEMFSKWYSWGSPVGLGIFFMSIAMATLLAVRAFNATGIRCPEKCSAQIETKCCE